MNELLGFKNISLYSKSIMRSGKAIVRKSVLDFFRCELNAYDRFKKFNGLMFEDKINWKYNLDGKCKKTFEEICIDRANELAEKYDKVIVFVSGGISSVTVISSFALINKLNQLVVVFDDETLENKSILIDWFKNNNIETELVNKNNFIDKINEIVTKYKNCILTNGLCGNALSHGHALFDIMADPENIKGENDFYHYIDADSSLKTKYIELSQQWIDTYSFKDSIKSFHHATWLANFSIRWTTMEPIYMFAFYPLPAKYHQAFFATQEFTDWAINNLDMILDGKPWLGKQYYKPHFKNVIRKVFKNEFDNVEKSRYNTLFNLDVFERISVDNVFATDGKNFYGLNFIEK